MAQTDDFDIEDINDKLNILLHMSTEICKYRSILLRTQITYLRTF